MEYNSVTFTAYLSAAIVAALLTVTYCYQFFKQQRTYVFSIAAATHTLNLLIIALSFGERDYSALTLLVYECLHYNVWVLCIALILLAATNKQRLPRSLKILFNIGWPLTAVALVASLANFEPLLRLSSWFALTLAVIGLACCFCMTSIFIPTA